MRGKAWFLGVALAGFVVPAHAGDPALIVTARRVAEVEDRVPISLIRVDRDDLARRGIDTLGDLAGVVPNLSIPTVGAFGAQQPILRGVFSPIGASTVGLYVDDVPVQIRSLEVAGNPDLRRFDLDRVEVLRGPQGTLFGADSMGGTIRYLTRQPRYDGLDAEVSGEVAAVKAGGLAREVQAALGSAILPGRIGARVSGYYRRDAGVIDRVDPVSGSRIVEDVDHVATLGLRVAAKAALGDRWEIVPALFYQKTARADLPFYESSLGPFRQSASLHQPGRDRFLLPSLVARLHLDGATLTSVTAWLDRRNRQIVDYSGFFGEIVLGGAVPGIRTPGGSYSRTTVAQRNFTQEVRLASDADGPVRWLIGGFYSQSRIIMEQRVVEPGITDLAQSQLGLSIEEIFGLPLLPGGQSYHSRQTIRERTVAAFGQAAWVLAPRWEATAGLRVSHNPLRFRLMSEGPFAGGSNAIGPKRQDDTPVTPYASLSWRPARDSLVYLSAGKGFRSGGTNGAVPAGSCAADLSVLGRMAAPDSYGSDSLWSYEAGVKAGLPARGLHLSIAVFRIDWRHIQQSITLPNCGFSYVDNLGSARNQGVELAVQAKPLRGLTLDFGLGFVDARFRKDVGQPRADGVGSIVAVGDRVPYVPRWTGALAAEYGFGLPGRLDGFLRSEWRHAGGYRRAPSVQSVAYDPRVHVGAGSDLLQLRVGLGRDGWELSLFADNLLDGRAVLYRNADLVPVTGSPLREMAQRPRTIGLSASLGL
ncbi:TonB-dependent receptor domain-containing protein [Sphingobium sp.]|uniref:TonB-dependent receptor n=1 Tax=Sphingobium sp. TaxID=1912891 RepID=UPI0028BDD74F|nr:TonB-dependent receptor [Sphingobium sp.]